MHRTLWIVALAAAAGLAAATSPPTHSAEKNEPMIAHNVYFSLHDNSPEAKARLVAACHKYLAKHPGVVFFAAGVLAEQYQRPVNDRDFDVALHVVFADAAAHDTYQDAEDHHAFIRENKENWKAVRVFDSLVER